MMSDENHVRELESVIIAQPGKAGHAQRVQNLKEELRLKMAARYGNRHDRRQAEAMGRKAATKAKHLAWKKALQKGTPVSATLLPDGAHQPSTYAVERQAWRDTPYEGEDAS